MTFYVSGSVSISDSAKITLTNPHPEQFAMYVSGGGPVNLSGMLSTTYGVLYAPGAAVTVGFNTELFGAVVGKTVTTRDFAEIHFHDGLLGVQPQTYTVQSADNNNTASTRRNRCTRHNTKTTATSANHNGQVWVASFSGAFRKACSAEKPWL